MQPGWWSKTHAQDGVREHVCTAVTVVSLFPPYILYLLFARETQHLICPHCGAASHISARNRHLPYTVLRQIDLYPTDLTRSRPIGLTQMFSPVPPADLGALRHARSPEWCRPDDAALVRHWIMLALINYVGGDIREEGADGAEEEKGGHAEAAADRGATILFFLSVR